MSTPPQDVWFENPNVGQRSRIVTLPHETGGRLFVLEYINQPFRGEDAVPPHVHPWSDSAEELHVRQVADADPPDWRGLDASLQAAITIQGLAKAGRVNAKGLPNLLQLGVLLETTMPATYLAGPPIVLQRVLFLALGGLGRLAGYKTAYPEYGVITGTGLEAPA